MEFFQNIGQMLFPSFDKNQTKVQLKGSMIRMKMLKAKTTEKISLQKREVKVLIQNGKDELARIRVEHIINDTNFIHALDLLELFCEKLETRLEVVSISTNIPEDMLETIHSVIYAAPRISQIPELAKVNQQLSLKYGKEYVEKIAHSGSHHLNHMLLHKLEIKSPEAYIVHKVLEDIVGPIEMPPSTFTQPPQPPMQPPVQPPPNYPPGPSNNGGGFTQPPQQNPINPIPSFPPPPYVDGSQSTPSFPIPPPSYTQNQYNSAPQNVVPPPTSSVPNTSAPTNDSPPAETAPLDLDDLTARFEALKKKTHPNQ